MYNSQLLAMGKRKFINNLNKQDKLIEEKLILIADVQR